MLKDEGNNKQSNPSQLAAYNRYRKFMVNSTHLNKCWLECTRDGYARLNVHSIMLYTRRVLPRLRCGD